MNIFITVGTTRFDGLVNVVSSKEFLSLASSLGYDTITIQHGKSPWNAQESSKIVHFDFSPDLSLHFKLANLVISHAGSGSILDALMAEKPLIVVVNDELMDNHQAEVAKALGQDGLQCCQWTTPFNLISTLETFDAKKLVPLPSKNSHALTKIMDDACGVME